MKTIIRALVMAPLWGVFLLGPAQAQKTKAELTTEVGTTFPDNIVGAITPLGVRTYEIDVINSIMPTAPVTNGNLACFDGTTGLLKDCAYAPNTLIVGTTSISSGTSNGILYNSSGALANTGSAAGAILNTNSSSIPSLTETPTLGVAGASVGSIALANATSGTVTIQPATGALGAAVASLPAGIYTVVGDSIVQTLTNKTISGASNTLTVRLASDVTGNLPLANIATGTQDTALGYWGSTAVSAISVPDCTGALTYSTSTHTIGCNSTTAGNVSTSGTPAAGQVAIWASSTTVNGTNYGTVQLTSVSQHAEPSNPGGSTSTTGIMMGLGATCKVTPATSGRVRFTITGSVTNNNASKISTVATRYGTGAAPSNGAALTGTALARGVTYINPTGTYTAPFSIEGIISGLSVGVQAWYDASLATNDPGTTSSISNLTCLAQEF